MMTRVIDTCVECTRCNGTFVVKDAAWPIGGE